MSENNLGFSRPKNLVWGTPKSSFGVRRPPNVKIVFVFNFLHIVRNDPVIKNGIEVFLGNAYQYHDEST